MRIVITVASIASNAITAVGNGAAKSKAVGGIQVARIFQVPFMRACTAAHKWVNGFGFGPKSVCFKPLYKSIQGIAYGSIGYAGGSLLLLGLLVLSIVVWYRTLGTVAVHSITSPKAEMFYWTTIMFSQTLGTASGDWTADTAGLGYAGAAAIFGGALVLIAVLYRATRVSRTALFLTAFILTRPLGAVVGDFLDKPIDHGGLALSRYTASAVLVVAMIICAWIFAWRARNRKKM